MDAEGNVTGLTEQLDAVRKDADYLFEAKQETNPTLKPTFGTGSQNNGGNNAEQQALRKAFGL